MVLSNLSNLSNMISVPSGLTQVEFLIYCALTAWSIYLNSQNSKRIEQKVAKNFQIIEVTNREQLQIAEEGKQLHFCVDEMKQKLVSIESKIDKTFGEFKEL